MSDDESGLIQRAVQGDATAWAALYDRHYHAVYRYCYYRVSDVILAQDLASEVFIRMVENIHAFDLRGRPLLAWLYTIARNLIADGYRQAKQVMPLLLEDLPTVEEDNPAQSVERRLAATQMAAALEHLTEDQHQVIFLKFIQNLTNSEVAYLLGKPEGAVKSLQHRALAALQRVLKDLRHEV
ncbi:MAG: sigma-70 family RNA polymerase sigma factor [Thermoflexales bacterium]|nr:sigma-70 family RNA polymerase sigma factor [Thermoflexales bacterium]